VFSPVVYLYAYHHYKVCSIRVDTLLNQVLQVLTAAAAATAAVTAEGIAVMQ
jgi:hypothetical protein